MTIDLLIRDVEVLQLSASLNILHHHDIHITGDRIAALTPTDAATDAKQFIDGAGMIALPASSTRTRIPRWFSFAASRKM